MHAEQLPDIQNLLTHSVVDKNGKIHLFADFWKEQRAALVFLRHFG